MRAAGKTIVITGAAGGIGAALARRFHAAGARLCLSDLTAPTALATSLNALPSTTSLNALPGATSLNALPGATDPGALPGAADPGAADAGSGGETKRPAVLAVGADVSVEDDVRRLVATAEAELGPIDLFCANAGIATGHGLDASDEEWARSWSINVMAHVYSARAVLPGMLARGEGYLLHTASAAGLLTSLGDAPYAVTKHGAVAFAEWLAAMYGDRGIRVSVLCPQGVRTPMLMDGLASGDPAALAVAASGRILEPDEVAQCVIDGLESERFLILPHPEVATFQQRKAVDPDRWLAGVRRLFPTS